MKDIRSITVTAVVLLFALSIFAGSAAAAHDPKDPDHDNLMPNTKFDDDDVPASDDTFLKAKKAFDEHFPDTIFDEKFPETVFDDKKGVMPGDRVSPPVFDDDGDQVADGPELQG